MNKIEELHNVSSEIAKLKHINEILDEQKQYNDKRIAELEKAFDKLKKEAILYLNDNL